jgi:hypothetical protein
MQPGDGLALLPPIAHIRAGMALEATDPQMLACLLTFAGPGCTFRGQLCCCLALRDAVVSVRYVVAWMLQ